MWEHTQYQTLFIKRCFNKVLHKRNRGKKKKRLKTIFCPPTRTVDEDLRVYWADPCSEKQWGNQKYSPPGLSCLALSTVNGKWCCCYSIWKVWVCCTYSDLTEEWSKGAHFLEDLHFLTGKNFLMTWNTIQPFQVSTMLFKVPHFNTKSVLLWKTLYVLGKGDLEAVGTQLCSLSLNSKCQLTPHHSKHWGYLMMDMLWSGFLEQLVKDSEGSLRSVNL